MKKVLRFDKDPNPQGRKNHGARWDAPQLLLLRRLWKSGMKFHDICEEMGRSYDSILQRLHGMKLVQYDAINYRYTYEVPDGIEESTQPETKLENDMTQPLQNLTLIFGSDIKSMTEPQLITAITKCTAEINSFNVIPRNKWTEKRTDELKAAIDAAVAELDTRG